jgi:hypothetical protein
VLATPPKVPKAVAQEPEVSAEPKLAPFTTAVIWALAEKDNASEISMILVMWPDLFGVM